MAAIPSNLREIAPRTAPDGTNWCVGCDTTISARADARLCPRCTVSRSNYRRTRNRKTARGGPPAQVIASRRQPKSRIKRTVPRAGVSTAPPESLESLVPFAISSFRALIELYEAKDWEAAKPRSREAAFEVRKTAVGLTQATVQLLVAAGLVEVDDFGHPSPSSPR